MSSLLRISVSLILISLNLASTGQDLFRSAVSAKEAGMGSLCLTGDGFWSSFQNQALLADSRELFVGVNYENRFSLKELGVKTVGVRLPAGKPSLGLIWSDFGYAGFRRGFTGISCGMKLSEKISGGIQIDYLTENAGREYTKSRSLTYEAGLLIKTSNNTRMGLRIVNALPVAMRNSFLPVKLSAGAGTKLNDLLYAGAEAEMSSATGLSLRTGFEYQAMKNAWLRGGYCSFNNSFSFGLGYLAKPIQIDFSFVTHEKLGLTTSISIIYKIK